MESPFSNIIPVLRVYYYQLYYTKPRLLWEKVGVWPSDVWGGVLPNRNRWASFVSYTLSSGAMIGQYTQKIISCMNAKFSLAPMYKQNIYLLRYTSISDLLERKKFTPRKYQSLKGAVVMELCQNEADVKCQMDIHTLVPIKRSCGNLHWKLYFCLILGRGSRQLLLSIPETSVQIFTLLQIVANIWTNWRKISTWWNTPFFLQCSYKWQIPFWLFIWLQASF